jgi:hypothetical protein
MPQPLFASDVETLAWFLGNTFALAAWWVISGFFSGVFLSMFSGTIGFMLTGQARSQVQVQRIVGVLGGAVVGMSGGATVGAIGNFSGVIGMVYLWGLVGMLLLAFQSAAQKNASFGRFDQDWDDLDADTSTADDRGSFISQVLAGVSQLGAGQRSTHEIVSAVVGGIIGVVYGVVTGFLVPLTASAPPSEDVGVTVARAAAIWAVLCGFGGWIVGTRGGVRGGMVVLVLGLVFGSVVGWFIAMIGDIFETTVVIGAINGALGGAFFGAIAAHELSHKRFP